MRWGEDTVGGKSEEKRNSPSGNHVILKRVKLEQSSTLLREVVLDDLLQDSVQTLLCSRGGLIEPRTINFGHFENYCMEKEWWEVS